MRRKISAGRCRFALAAIAMLSLAVGCEPPNPDANTPTSGRLVVYVDEIYAPLFRTLADSFMVRSPNATIDVRVAPARMSVQELFDAAARDTARTDTSTTTAAILGRKLLPDELEAIRSAGYNSKEYILAYDGLAVVVPVSSPLRSSTVEQLRNAVTAPAPIMSMLDSNAPADALRFLLPDQNSSAYVAARDQLADGSGLTASARYFGTADSVLAAVAAGEGIGILGWLPAHRDSLRLRTLSLGFADSVGREHPPAIVHPTSLVTDAYPLKQTLVGYTFASNRSLAVGFLAWLAKGQDAQYYMTYQGLQPENVKLRIVMPEAAQ